MVLFRLLNEAHLPHNVLNAKNHAKEAEIIAHAGEAGAITIATNMAGRGTDIKLDEEARKAGGLCVFGTERHESRRIDNQLRGRSGRQGDPGYTRFFISLDDELMRRFGSDRLRSLYSSLDDEALESKMVQSAITNAQKRIEGQNFDTRKSLLDYDDVLRKQREIMYKKRDNILFASDIHEMIEEFFKQAGVALAKKSLNPNDPSLGVSGELLKAQLEPRFLEAGTIKPAAYDESPADEVGEDVAILMWKRYLERRKEWGDEVAENMERNFALRCIDRNWTSHIDTMDKLREGIHLRSYANTNPLQDYVNEGYKLFGEMMDIIAIEVVLNLLNVQVQMKKPDEEEEHPEEKGE